MIKLIKVLEEPDLKRALALVTSLKEHYEPLPEGFYFETLGAASYLHYGNEHVGDEPNGVKYHLVKKRSNPILKENFQWLYNILIKTLSEELKDSCSISDEYNLAFPGFHIFYPYEGCERVSHPAHLDCQWSYHLESLNEKFNSVDDNKFLTFTLSIKLPKSGAGLYYWDLPDYNKEYSFAEAENFYKDILEKTNDLFVNNEGSISKEEFERITNPSILKYEEGFMTIFTHPILHQIMPFNLPYSKDEIRITLQGHGIKCDGIWRLYF